MSILIIGGTGELGRNVVAAAEANWKGEIIATYRTTSPPLPTIQPNRVTWHSLDCSDHAEVRTFLLSISKLDTIAYCAVPKGSNANAKESSTLREGIVSDVVHCAEAAALMGARFIAISTDLVFDGTRPESESYTEDDSANAINVYGKYKTEMESKLLSLSGNIVIARTSLILSLERSKNGEWTSGKGIQFLVDCLKGKFGQIDIFTDERRSMSFADDLGRGVLELCDRECAFERGVIHLSADECTDRWELTKLLAKLLSLDDGIEKYARAGLSKNSGLKGRPLNCELSSTLRKSTLKTNIRGLSERFADLLNK